MDRIILAELRRSWAVPLMTLSLGVLIILLAASLIGEVESKTEPEKIFSVILILHLISAGNNTMATAKNPKRILSALPLSSSRINLSFLLSALLAHSLVIVNWIGCWFLFQTLGLPQYDWLWGIAFFVWYIPKVGYLHSRWPTFAYSGTLILLMFHKFGIFTIGDQFWNWLNTPWPVVILALVSGWMTSFSLRKRPSQRFV